MGDIVVYTTFYFKSDHVEFVEWLMKARFTRMKSITHSASGVGVCTIARCLGKCLSVVPVMSWGRSYSLQIDCHR